MHEEHAEVDEEDLLGEREEGGDEEVDELDVAGCEDGGGEVRGDGGQADHEDDPEAAVAGEAGEGAVVEVGALELGRASAERVEEGVPRSDCTVLVPGEDEGRGETYSRREKCPPRRWQSRSRGPRRHRTAARRSRARRAAGRR